MTIETLAAWILSVMMATVPPGHSKRPAPARETAAQGKARYRAIAKAIAEVSLDPKEAPLYDGPAARAKTAALMLTISLHESHWRRDVDLGLGRKTRYWCMMQIAVDSGKTPEGWTRQQLVQSRERCFRRGLHILQRGRKYCKGTKDAKGNKDEHAFVNHYASGYCDRGRKAVAKRIRTLRRLLKKHPLPAGGNAQR